MLRITTKLCPTAYQYSTSTLSFRPTHFQRGIEEFVDTSFLEGKQVSSAGRAWRISELRRKSFEDLHKLYFALFKERNLLLTHREFAKSMGGKVGHPERMYKVRKSMARIQLVLAERQQYAQFLAKREFNRNFSQGIYHENFTNHIAPLLQQQLPSSSKQE